MFRMRNLLIGLSIIGTLSASDWDSDFYALRVEPQQRGMHQKKRQYQQWLENSKRANNDEFEMTRQLRDLKKVHQAMEARKAQMSKATPGTWRTAEVKPTIDEATQKALEERRNAWLTSPRKSEQQDYRREWYFDDLNRAIWEGHGAAKPKNLADMRDTDPRRKQYLKDQKKDLKNSEERSRLWSAMRSRRTPEEQAYINWHLNNPEKNADDVVPDLQRRLSQNTRPVGSTFRSMGKALNDWTTRTYNYWYR